MSPRCSDCSNTTRFVHLVTGEVTRVYDDGTVVDEDHTGLDTTRVWCAACDSIALRPHGGQQDHD